MTQQRIHTTQTKTHTHIIAVIYTNGRGNMTIFSALIAFLLFTHIISPYYGRVATATTAAAAAAVVVVIRQISCGTERQQARRRQPSTYELTTMVVHSIK